MATKPDFSIPSSNGLYSIWQAMTFSPAIGTDLARLTSALHSLRPMYLICSLFTNSARVSITTVTSK